MEQAEKQKHRLTEQDRKPENTHTHTPMGILSLTREARLREREHCSVMCKSLHYTPHALYSTWNSPGQNTGVGGCSLLHGNFPTQGSNLSLWHCKQILYQLSHKIKCGFLQLSFSDLGFTSSSNTHTHTPLCTHTSHLRTHTHRVSAPCRGSAPLEG